MLHFFTKMRKMPDLDWTQHIKMDYTVHPKFEGKPSKDQNKTISMFLHDTACPFHSAAESRIYSNFMEFDQNGNFSGNYGNC